MKNKRMKLFLDLTFKDRLKIVVNCMIAAFFTLFITDETRTEDVRFVLGYLHFSEAILKSALGPSKELFRHEVDSRPYEPFGEPNVMTTVKPEDNIIPVNPEQKTWRYPYNDTDNKHPIMFNEDDLTPGRIKDQLDKE